MAFVDAGVRADCHSAGLRGVQFRIAAPCRSVFGDVALVVFLLAQALDGVLTYVGVSVYGPRMEGNPALAWLMAMVGQGPALAMAKSLASVFGIALHLNAGHRIVAVLTAFYIAAAVLPWVGILYW
jgi:uncharacterized membrane protein